jgi:hypothetical protein
MPMVLQFFEWLQKTQIGDTIRQSKWLFPAIESLHLMGLAVLGGAVLLVNLRLMGFGLTRQPVRQVAADVQPWLIGSLIAMFITGGLQFSAEAVKCYYHVAFWVKMASLLLAILFTFTIQKRVISGDETPNVLLRNRLVALISMVLWSGVGISGRWIGFS